MRFGSSMSSRLNPATRLLIIALVTLTACWLAPVPVLAHAALVDSQPEAGSELDGAPDAVVLEFSEPLIADLSDATVTDPDGGDWPRTSAGESSMRVRLDTDAEGIYSVAWKTVSPLDGHTLRGRFTFGVGVDPGEQPPPSTAPGAGGVVVAALRVVEYAGLLAAVGMLLLRHLASRDPALGWVRPRLRWPLAIALVGGVTVVTGEALLAVSSPSPAALGGFLGAEPGLPRLARLAAVAFALVAVTSGAVRLAAVAVGASLIGLAASGHAAGAGPATGAVAVQALHLTAVGLWAGTILALVGLRPPGGWRDRAGRELLRRFSPVAIWAFLVTVATGTLRGAHELVAVSDLWADPYGRVLGLKIIAVVLMVPLSLRAWRLRSPRPRLEAALAVVALGAAAVLAAFPLPPQRAAVEVTADDVEDPSIPQGGDLTVGVDVDQVLIGLTFRTADRTDDVFVHVGTSPREDADDVDVELHVDGREMELERCGGTCRHIHTHLGGGEVIEVGVDGSDETVAVTLPEDTAAEGRGLLERLDQRMGELERIRYDEEFRPADPAIVSTAWLEAPDRLHFVQHTTGRETIRVGDTIYRREGPDERWRASSGPSLTVPAYIWDEADRIAPRVWGTEMIDGTETEVLTFFVDHRTTPIWYRLWADAEGLVHQAEMRAVGHFMDHRYGDFDGDFTVEPPSEDEVERDED